MFVKLIQMADDSLGRLEQIGKAVKYEGVQFMMKTVLVVYGLETVIISVTVVLSIFWTLKKFITAWLNTPRDSGPSPSAAVSVLDASNLSVAFDSKSSGDAVGSTLFISNKVILLINLIKM